MKKAIFIFALLLLPAAVFSQNIPPEAENEITAQTQKFQTLLQTVYKYYKDTVNIKKISETAFNAMLKDLDNFSEYFSAEQYKSINDTYKGSSLSTGISLLSLNDTIVVTAISPASPAETAGIIPGDKILFINGQNAYKMTGAEALAKVNQVADTIVSLIIRRGYSPSLNEYKIEKKEVAISTIAASFILPKTKIGYIKFIKFSSIADKEFREAVSKLKGDGMKQLIVDLRGNSGGYLEQVEAMADDILPGNDTITFTKARCPDFLTSYVSKSGQEFEDIPLIILIDGSSASASEILSGSVQDLDRGIIIGQISFGKGSVQKMWEFKDGSAFRITVAGYYTPSGRNIQKYPQKEQMELNAAAKLNLGESTQKMLEDIIKQTGGKSYLPTYKSKHGRTIIGGGGIFPDYFIKDDTTTVLTQVLKNNGFFLEFSYKYLYIHRDEIVNKYKDDYIRFNENFEVDDKLLNAFIDYSRSKNVWNVKMYETDKNIIRGYIKAYITYSVWGDKAYFLALMPFDAQMRKAVEVMPEAAGLINHK